MWWINNVALIPVPRHLASRSAVRCALPLASRSPLAQTCAETSSDATRIAIGQNTHVINLLTAIVTPNYDPKSPKPSSTNGANESSLAYSRAATSSSHASGPRAHASYASSRSRGTRPRRRMRRTGRCWVPRWSLMPASSTRSSLKKARGRAAPGGSCAASGSRMASGAV